MPRSPKAVIGETIEVLERRAVHVILEQQKARKTTADGHSTLTLDESPHGGRRSESYEGSRKTRAEKAAERARLHALCEAIELLTGESFLAVESRLKDERFDIMDREQAKRQARKAA